MYCNAPEPNQVRFWSVINIQLNLIINHLVTEHLIVFGCWMFNRVWLTKWYPVRLHHVCIWVTWTIWRAEWIRKTHRSLQHRARLLMLCKVTYLMERSNFPLERSDFWGDQTGRAMMELTIALCYYFIVRSVLKISFKYKYCQCALFCCLRNQYPSP